VSEIVPEVPEAILRQYEPELVNAGQSALRTIEANGLNVKADIADAKAEAAKVKADKSAIVAAVLHIAVLLVSALYLKLPAKDVAVLGSIVAGGTGYFVTAASILRSKL
jgi:hypothetical protein